MNYEAVEQPGYTGSVNNQSPDNFTPISLERLVKFFMFVSSKTLQYILLSTTEGTVHYGQGQGGPSPNSCIALGTTN